MAASGNTGQQQGGSTPWNRHHSTEKNTFLHIAPPLEDSPEGWFMLRRQTSDPLPIFSRDASRARSSGSQASRSNLFQVLDGLLFGDATRGEDDGEDCSAATSTRADSAPAAVAPLPDQGDGEDCPGSAVPEAQSRRGEVEADPEAVDTDDSESTLGSPGSTELKFRPLRQNRRKRVRNRELVEQLKRQIEDNPHGFDPDTYAWPPSVMDNAQLRHILTRKLHKHRETVLRQSCRQQALRQHSGRGGSSSSSAAVAAATPASPSANMRRGIYRPAPRRV